MKYRTTSHHPSHLTSLCPIPYVLTSIFFFMKDRNVNKPSGGFLSSNSFRALQDEGHYSPSPVFCYSYKPLSMMFKKIQSARLSILYPKGWVTFIKDSLLFTPSCSNLDNPCVTHSTEAINKTETLSLQENPWLDYWQEQDRTKPRPGSSGKLVFTHGWNQSGSHSVFEFLCKQKLNINHFYNRCGKFNTLRSDQR